MAEYLPDESVDLIYLDPPFNSKRIYRAFIGGAQWVAFDDAWRWHEAIDEYFSRRLPDLPLADFRRPCAGLFVRSPSPLPPK